MNNIRKTFTKIDQTKKLIKSMAVLTALWAILVLALLVYIATKVSI